MRTIFDTLSKSGALDNAFYSAVSLYFIGIMEGCGVRLLPLLRLYLYFIHIPVHIHLRHVLI